MINSKGNANQATVLAADMARNMHYEPNLVGCSNALKNSAVVCMSSFRAELPAPYVYLAWIIQQG